MKAKEKFIKIYNQLPEKTKTELTYKPYNDPTSLRVIGNEVINDTSESKWLLKDLGFEDD